MTANGGVAYAGPVRRIGAAVIDLYWMLPRLIVTFLLISPLSLLAPTPESPWAPAIGLLLLAILSGVPLLSLAAWESSPTGASPGKLFMGLRIVDKEGAPLPFARASIRNGVKAFLWPFFPAAFLSSRQQAPADILAGALAVRIPPDWETRRRAFLVRWNEGFAQVFVPIVFGVITIPVGVGFLILLVWLPKWWAFRSDARRRLLDIPEGRFAEAGANAN